METISSNQSEQCSSCSLDEFRLERLMAESLEREFSEVIHRACSEIFSSEWTDLSFEKAKAACVRRTLAILEKKKQGEA